jgi:general secretion pathway protein J
MKRRPQRARRTRQHGFTLLELTIALLLLALMSAVLFGSLKLSATSWDKGEAKTDRSNEMRLTEDFLRKTLTSQHPLRLHKAAERPLYFNGAQDSISFAAVPPGRAATGMYYFRVMLTGGMEGQRLSLLRVIPDASETEPPGFDGADSSILAEGIAQMKIGYYGRDKDAAETAEATWRDRWDDPQRIPDLIRIDVTPVTGDPWPTLVVEPRISAQAGCRVTDPTGTRCLGN